MKTMKRIKLRMAIARAARIRNKADAERYIQFIQKLKVIRSSQSKTGYLFVYMGDK